MVSLLRRNDRYYSDQFIDLKTYTAVRHVLFIILHIMHLKYPTHYVSIILNVVSYLVRYVAFLAFFYIILILYYFQKTSK